jgi:nitrogen regulatory protein P-II 1
MKLIRSVIRQSKIDQVKGALRDANVLAMTVAEVLDHAPENAHEFVWMGHEFVRDDSARFEISIVVHDADADEVVDVIVRSARTGERADGYVTVLPVEHRYNIHTGQREVS